MKRNIHNRKKHQPTKYTDENKIIAFKAAMKLAGQLYESKKYEFAARSVKIALSIDQKVLNPEDLYQVYYLAGLICEQEKKIDNAITMLNKAIALRLLNPLDQNIFHCGPNELHTYTSGAFIALGKIFESQAKYEKCIEIYKRGIQQFEDNTSLWLELGDLYQTKLNNNEEALKCYEKVLTFSTNADCDLDALYNAGVEIRDQAKNDEDRYKALEYFNKILEFDDASLDAYHVKAGILESMQQFTDAVDCYERITKHNKKDGAAYFNKAVILFYHLDNTEEAQINVEAALKYHSELKLYDKISLYCLKGEIALSKQTWSEAVKYFELALREDRNNKDSDLQDVWKLSGYTKELVYSNLAKSYEASGKKQEAIEVLHIAAGWYLENNHAKEAIICYDKALAMDPEHALSHYKKGEILLNNHDPEWIPTIMTAAKFFSKLKNYKQTISCYDKILSVEPNYTPALGNKGDLLYHQQKFGEALILFDKILALSKNKNISALYLKGLSLAQMGRVTESLQCFEDVLELNQDNIHALLNKGAMLMISNRPQDALLCFDKILCMPHGNHIFWVLHQKSKIFKMLGEFDKQIKCLEEILTMQPKCTPMINEKGIAYLALKDHENALKCFATVLEYNPQDTIANLCSGEVAIKVFSDYNKALGYFEDILKYEPNNIKAIYYKGLAHASLFEFDTAIGLLNKIHTVYPDNALIKQAIQNVTEAKYKYAQYNTQYNIDPDKQKSKLPKQDDKAQLEKQKIIKELLDNLFKSSEDSEISSILSELKIIDNRELGETVHSILQDEKNAALSAIQNPEESAISAPEAYQYDPDFHCITYKSKKAKWYISKKEFGTLNSQLIFITEEVANKSIYLKQILAKLNDNSENALKPLIVESIYELRSNYDERLIGKQYNKYIIFNQITDHDNLNAKAVSLSQTSQLQEEAQCIYEDIIKLQGDNLDIFDYFHEAYQ